MSEYRTFSINKPLTVVKPPDNLIEDKYEYLRQSDIDYKALYVKETVREEWHRQLSVIFNDIKQ